MDTNSDKNIFEQYAELVRRFKAGDELAFNEIYEKSKRLVYTTCYGILGNEQDAEDASQETYTTVYLKIKELEDENVFLQWLKRIAANKARDKFKVRKGDISYDDAIESGEDLEGNDDIELLPDTYIMDKAKRDALLNIMKSNLKDVQYQTILLFYYDELSYKDISEIMECSTDTVKYRLKQSREIIVAKVKEYEKINKDSLMGAAAGVPFLTRFFSETFKDIPVPSTKFTLPKSVPASKPVGAVKDVASTATKVGGTAAKGTVTLSPIIQAAIAVVAIAAVAIPTIVIIKKVTDKKPKDFKIDYDGIYSFVDEEDEINNCLRFYPDGDLIYTSYEFGEEDSDSLFPVGSWFTIESDDSRVDEGTYEIEDNTITITIDSDSDPIVFVGEMDENGIALTPDSDPDSDPMVYEFVSFDDLPDYLPEVEEEDVFVLDGCVMNWNGHSYSLFDNCSSWEEAEEYCESLGGHLATITSQEENDAVYAFAQSMSCDNVYLGLSDTAEEGVWAWVNGESYDYSNWNEGEPNGFTEGEDYAVLVYNGCWYDCEYTPSYENGPIVYVCEWDSEIEATTVVYAEDLVVEEVVVETEPEETEPETFAPVVVSASDIPDYDQLSSFVTTWTFGGYHEAIDAGYLDAYSLFNGGQSGTPLDYSLYADDIIFTNNSYRMTEVELVWIEENIINLTDSEISSLSPSVEMFFLDSDGYIRIDYSSGGGYNSVNISGDILYDGICYYVTTDLHGYEGDSPFEYNLYFTMQYRNIDGRDFWTMIDCSSTSFDFSTAPTMNALGDWAPAYLEKASSISANDFLDEWDEPHCSDTFSYDLAYINADDIPELVVSTQVVENYARTGEQTFTYANIYTFHNGEVIELCHMCVDFEYYPRENVFGPMYGYTDYAGGHYSTTSYSINAEGNGINTSLFEACAVDMEVYPDIWSGLDSGAASDDWYYYSDDPVTYEITRISEEEFNNATSGTGDPVEVSGTMTLEQLTAQLS